jgi:hypothetical protein
MQSKTLTIPRELGRQPVSAGSVTEVQQTEVGRANVATTRTTDEPGLVGKEIQSESLHARAVSTKQMEWSTDQEIRIRALVAGK